MNMNYSLQKLKTGDKTWVCYTDDGLDYFEGENCETSQWNELRVIKELSVMRKKSLPL